MQHEVVWLKTHRRYAFLLNRGAYYSTVYWVEDEVEIEDQVENDDYEFWSEHAISVEPDDD